MKLKSRITTLFFAVIVCFLSTVILSSINQNNILDDFNKSLTSLSAGEQSFEEVIRNGKSDYYRLKNRTAVQVGIAVCVVLFIFVLGFYLINHHVNRRLQKIITFYRMKKSGRYPHARLLIGGDDELNMISSVLNASLDEKELISVKLESTLVQQRRLLVSVINADENKAAFFRLNGDFIASNLSEEDQTQVSKLVKEKLVDIFRHEGTVEFDCQGSFKVRCSFIGPSSGIKAFIKVKCIEKN